MNIKCRNKQISRSSRIFNWIFFVIDSFSLRQDTHKKKCLSVFFSVRTTKEGCREDKSPWTLSKKHFFSLKSDCFSPKIGKKKKKTLNPFQAIIRQKKVAWTTKPKAEITPQPWGSLPPNPEDYPPTLKISDPSHPQPTCTWHTSNYEPWNMRFNSEIWEYHFSEIISCLQPNTEKRKFIELWIRQPSVQYTVIYLAGLVS